MRVPLHLDVFMFSTRPMDCACVQTPRRVSGTHLFLPTTTRFCDLARAHAYNIEKISNDAKRRGFRSDLGLGVDPSVLRFLRARGQMCGVDENYSLGWLGPVWSWTEGNGLVEKVRCQYGK